MLQMFLTFAVVVGTAGIAAIVLSKYAVEEAKRERARLPLRVAARGVSRRREEELPFERGMRIVGMARPGGSPKYVVSDFGTPVDPRRDEKIFVGGLMGGVIQLEKATSIRATGIEAFLEAINSQRESKPGKERRVSLTRAKV